MLNSASLQKYNVSFENDESILKFFEARWKNRDYYKGHLEARWLNNLAKYEGFYHLNYNEAFKNFTENTDIPPWRVRLISNLALPIVRTTVTKFVRNRPIWDVIPAKQDTKAIQRASAQKQFLRAYWFQHGINYEFIDLLLWLGITGEAYYYVYWDPDKGPTQKITPNDFLDPKIAGQMSSEEELIPVLVDAQKKFQDFVRSNGSDTLWLGDTCVETVSPFEMLYPFTNNFENKSWMIRGLVRDISHFVEKGLSPDQFATPSMMDSKYLYFNRRINNTVLFARQTNASNTSLNDDKEILELQCYFPKSRQFPEGLWAVIAGGKLIQKSGIPYNHKQIPYIHFYGEKSPGKTSGFSALDQALPLIEERQHIMSQVVEIKNMMAKPKIMASRSSALLKTAWTSEPGEIVEYSGLQAPSPWTPPGIPRYVFDLMGILQQDINDITAQRDATKGINPAGVRSATALLNLQDQDEGQLAGIGLMLDTGLSATGRLVLSTSAQFMSEDRFFSYTGEKSRFQSFQTNGQSLGGEEDVPGIDYFNVRVTQFSQYGLSRAGQLEFMKMLLQYNIYTAADRSKVMQFIQMGYFEDALDEFKVDRSNAHTENLLMAQGMVIQPTIADHHQTHEEEHLVFMKTDDFRNAPPQIQMIFNNHLRLTKMLKYQQLSEPRVLGLKGLLMTAQIEKVPPELVLGVQGNAG